MHNILYVLKNRGSNNFTWRRSLYLQIVRCFFEATFLRCWLKLMRMIIEGLTMAVCFNLYAATVGLYNSRLLFVYYPPDIIKNSSKRSLLP